jgi:hypothetical protein
MLGAKPKVVNNDRIVAATCAREYLTPGVGNLVEATCSAHPGACSQLPIPPF